VIVEKPLAVSLDEAEAIVAACRASGVGLAYAEELAFVPKFRRAREIARSGALGELLYVTQREAHAGPHSPWFFTRDEAGGGVLMDMACHSIECVRWLLDKPPVASVTARLARTLHRERTALEDHAVVQLEFAGGVQATCEASWALQGGMQSRLEAWGSTGCLDVDLLQRTGLRQYSAAGWTTPLADWLLDNGYPQELSHFLRCFAEGREPEEGGADGVAVLEILQAAYASAREGRSVALPFRPAGVERAVDLWLGRPER
jgi:predicted dehydrogenase